MKFGMKSVRGLLVAGMVAGVSALVWYLAWVSGHLIEYVVFLVGLTVGILVSESDVGVGDLLLVFLATPGFVVAHLVLNFGDVVYGVRERLFYRRLGVKGDWELKDRVSDLLEGAFSDCEVEVSNAYVTPVKGGHVSEEGSPGIVVILCWRSVGCLKEKFESWEDEVRAVVCKEFKVPCDRVAVYSSAYGDDE